MEYIFAICPCKLLTMPSCDFRLALVLSSAALCLVSRAKALFFSALSLPCSVASLFAWLITAVRFPLLMEFKAFVIPALEDLALSNICIYCLSCSIPCSVFGPAIPPILEWRESLCIALLALCIAEVIRTKSFMRLLSSAWADLAILSCSW